MTDRERALEVLDSDLEKLVQAYPIKGVPDGAWWKERHDLYNAVKFYKDHALVRAALMQPEVDLGRVREALLHAYCVTAAELYPAENKAIGEALAIIDAAKKGDGG